VALDKVATRSYFISMRAVGIKVLKNKLSEYVRLAANGETILVAEMTRPKTDRDATRGDAWWAEAVRTGLIRPASVDSAMPPPPRAALVPFDQLMKELEADREDR
jgi:antitoxin (DNA-binding transcriptional repressor) of toxin-antitoxin stability system